MPSLSQDSLSKLATCDPRLQKVIEAVSAYFPCVVLQGKRSETEEAANIAKGVSHTSHSKHVYPLGAPSLAVDVAPTLLGEVRWPEHETTNAGRVARLGRFYFFAGAVEVIARQQGVTVRWGGDWDSDGDFTNQTFNDLPHFELED